MTHSFTHSFVRSFVHSSVSLRTARHVQAQRETRITTQHLRTCLCQKACLVRTAPFFSSHPRHGMVVWFCAPSIFCVFLYFEGSFAYFTVFPSVFFPVFVSVFRWFGCGKSSPLEQLLMVFGAYSRMSLRSIGALRDK